MADYAAAIDQGTTSTRFMIFYHSGQVVAIDQREKTVVWDRTTGDPVYNAIVWQDTRTDQICNELSADGGQDRFRATTGLPIATYFSGPKIKWILDNVEGARARA